MINAESFSTQVLESLSMKCKRLSGNDFSDRCCFFRIPRIHSRVLVRGEEPNIFVHGAICQRAKDHASGNRHDDDKGVGAGITQEGFFETVAGIYFLLL